MSDRFYAGVWKSQALEYNAQLCSQWSQEGEHVSLDGWGAQPEPGPDVRFGGRQPLSLGCPYPRFGFHLHLTPAAFNLARSLPSRMLGALSLLDGYFFYIFWIAQTSDPGQKNSPTARSSRLWANGEKTVSCAWRLLTLTGMQIF